jgi:hypothetical protein
VIFCTRDNEQFMGEKAKRNREKEVKEPEMM